VSIIYTPSVDYVFTGRDDSPSDALVVREIWVENVYRVSESDIDDTYRVIDLGANIGAFSAFCMSLGANVTAVEPQPGNRKLLTENLKAAAKVSGKKYRILPLAVDAEAGEVRISDGHGGSRLGDDGDLVEAVTLHDIYELAGNPYCDVLKIDVEGSEYPILLNAPQDVLRKARYITLEFDAEPGPGLFGELVTKLAQDFHVEILGAPARGGYIYARRYD
jgi:FkbM family methyltransferase